MHTNKGYILPVILVVILLIIGGIFIFNQKQVESPTLETTQVATTTTETSPVVIEDKSSINDVNSESDTEMKEYTFTCSDDTEGLVTFNLVNNTALVNVDGKTQNLKVGMTGSGVRYTNIDESYVFWNKGDSAFIQMNGKTIHDDCKLIHSI